MKVKVNEMEVFWLLKSFNINTGTHANNMLQTELGADLAVCFVAMQLGHHSYIWELPGDSWLKRSEAPLHEVELVNTAYRNLQTAVRRKLTNERMANNLLSVPNDDFIYYQIEPSGNVRIMLTGWGFKNFQGAQGGPIKKEWSEPETKQVVRIALMIAGKPVPRREFYCQFLHQKKPNLFVTFDDGYYPFEQPLSVGAAIQITDKMTNQQFDLVVIEGQRDYEYDVTQCCTTTVTVLQDGLPKENEPVVIGYNGEERQLQTDALGCASISLPYIYNNDIEVEIRNSKQQQTVELAGNCFDFAFVTPPEPFTPPESPVPSAEEVEITICVMQDGLPKPGESVSVGYNGMHCTLQTDISGRAVTALPYLTGQIVVVNVRDLVQQKNILLGENNFMFTFVTELPPSSSHVENVKITVRVVQDGEPKSGEPVTIGYNDRDCMLQTNTSGLATTVLPYMAGGEVVVNVRDLMQRKTIAFDGNDFVFTFTTSSSSSSSPVVNEIELRVEEVEGQPLSNQEIILKQNEKQFSCKLDNNGCCHFEEDCFETGKEILVTFSDTTGKLIHVAFSIEEDEYQYLVVEQTKKQSPWIIALEIFLLVMSVVVLWSLYPYFVEWAEKLARGLG